MEFLVFIAVGAVAGVVAGLLGVGGGVVMVPALDLVFAALGYPPQTSHHVALGTSLACIVFTAASSTRAHHKRDAVQWPIVKSVAPGLLLGTLLGSRLAALLPTQPLKIIFIVFLFYISAQMLLGFKPKPSRQLPDWQGMTLIGTGIGVTAALVGIGGGGIFVPVLTFCNVAMHMAVGTAAAIGIPVALAGTAGYVINGLGNPHLPPHTVGYVSLTALAGITVMSVFTAPLGAKLAHSLPVKALKKVFAGFLLIMAVRMLLGVL